MSLFSSRERHLIHYDCAFGRCRGADASLTEAKTSRKLNDDDHAGLPHQTSPLHTPNRTRIAMRIILCRAGQYRRVLCWTLATATATVPSISVMAQTNAAAMSVRQRFEGNSPEAPVPRQPQGVQQSGPGPSGPNELSSGKIDTRYIASRAAVVVVVRPSQLLASPLAQVFPVEVASAAALKHLGFDSAEIEEVVGCFDLSNPTAPAYAVTFKFKNPIRASSIPPEMRAHAQLAELGGKKYLRSAVPTMHSLYGPNNKTLIAATDAALRQMVDNTSQPKTGPLLDRVREVPAGSDLYVAVDVATLRPFIQMIVGQAQALGKAPPETKQGLEMLNLFSAVELTLNVSAPGPTSLVVHCADDAAAQKVESTVQESLQKLRDSRPTEQPVGDDPIAQGMQRYKDRMLQLFQPQRNGSSVTCIHLDGQNPAQQQVVAVAIIGATVAAILPAIQAARAAAMRAPAAQNPGGPPEGPVAPSSPEPARQ